MTHQPPTKGVFAEIGEHSGSFALVFLLLFGLTFGFLAFMGATPDAPGTSKDSDLALNGKANEPVPPPPAVTTQSATQATPNGSAAREGALPTRIVIAKIGLDVSVANPESTNAAALDRELLKGAVRYPTSGTLGVNGTVLLFGHSSYLPIVHNQAYKAFDGIQDLRVGDEVLVYSEGEVYRFAVTGKRVADANSDIVELPQDGQHLTLVTCDSFATKSNRFVVTADLVQ